MIILIYLRLLIGRSNEIKKHTLECDTNVLQKKTWFQNYRILSFRNENHYDIKMEMKTF